MHGFLKQTLLFLLVLVLLSFGGSFIAKCVSINNQTSMVRITLIDLNHDEIYFSSSIISLDRCDGV